MADRVVRIWALMAALVLCSTELSVAAERSGSVIAVFDGDTVEVLHEKKAIRIRLHGIDCPEKDQSSGKQATQATSALIFGKQVTLHTYGKGKYGRTLADVLLPDGSNVNQQLVRDGCCWWYDKYAPDDSALKRAQEEAKGAKRGLWAEANPVPPWLYRGKPEPISNGR